ncbi:MAG: GNAT family N-acetyltransferase [Oceanicaulis sp.]|uniref:GNAT family N-acetyltransferase n=1 Tax=Oceanicaulis sp. TaxID=1924941 RepID=UPI000C664EB4|nr:GNAT family N-acetyltransferase [Oceanicaulis sp.]MAB70774.1 GNAT family N-acetyltransferase [Oceanicaulis sp.]MBC37624.1 GNAT family N-acetyltransferase [Oceanicaulis sp.]HBU62721.1 GNAT family N-acetyltransferase [Oceanicaulis sp.]|tara:strand:- start:1327 stop:1827 length:501 start_codon:yes stop_codon:yes gene_type:complete
MIERDASSLYFGDLGAVPPEQLVTHMNDPRVAAHLPLLTRRWTVDDAVAFQAAKAQRWLEDGLGHWAIHAGDRYVGWGGFEKEGAVWDFGLVLTAEAFGLGRRVFLKALDFARQDDRIDRISVLLAPSRKHLSALTRYGAEFVGEDEHAGQRFLRYELTPSKSPGQ